MRHSRLKPQFGGLLLALLLVAIFCTPSDAVDDEQEKKKSPELQQLENFIQSTHGNMTIDIYEKSKRWSIIIHIHSFNGLGNKLLEVLRPLDSLEVESISLSIYGDALLGSELTPFLKNITVNGAIGLFVELYYPKQMLLEEFPKYIFSSSVDSVGFYYVAIPGPISESMFFGPNALPSVRIFCSACWFNARKQADGSLEGILFSFYPPFEGHDRSEIYARAYDNTSALADSMNSIPSVHELTIDLSGVRDSGANLSSLKFIDYLKLVNGEDWWESLQNFPLLPRISSDENGKLHVDMHHLDFDFASPMAVETMIRETSTFLESFPDGTLRLGYWFRCLFVDDIWSPDNPSLFFSSYSASTRWTIDIKNEFTEFDALSSWLDQIPSLINMDIYAKAMKNSGAHPQDWHYIQHLTIGDSDDSVGWKLEHFPGNLKRLSLYPDSWVERWERLPWEIARLPPSLEKLYIEDTSLRGTLPTLPCNMTSVYVVGNDNLSGTLPDLPRHMTSVTVVGNDNLSVIIDESWCKARGLEKIWVESNNYDSSRNRVPSCIWKLPKLDYAHVCMNEDRFVSVAELVEMCDSSVRSGQICRTYKDHWDCPWNPKLLALWVWCAIGMATVVVLACEKLCVYADENEDEALPLCCLCWDHCCGLFQVLFYVVNIGYYGFLFAILRQTQYCWFFAAGIVLHFLFGFYFWIVEINRLGAKPSIGELDDDGSEVPLAGTTTENTDVGPDSTVLLDNGTLFDRVFFGWPGDESGIRQIMIRIAKVVAVDFPGFIFVEMLSVVVGVTCFEKLGRVSGLFDFKAYFRLRFRSLVNFLAPCVASVLSVCYVLRASEWMYLGLNFLLFMALPAISTFTGIVMVVEPKN